MNYFFALIVEIFGAFSRPTSRLYSKIGADIRFQSSIVYLRRACYVAAVGATFSSLLTVLILSPRNSPAMSRTLPKKTNPLILSDASPACKSHLEARGRAIAHATGVPLYRTYQLAFYARPR